VGDFVDGGSLIECTWCNDTSRHVASRHVTSRHVTSRCVKSMKYEEKFSEYVEKIDSIVLQKKSDFAKGKCRSGVRIVQNPYILTFHIFREKKINNMISWKKVYIFLDLTSDLESA
jgi:hypothetical protein